jgi:hypothetical protein
MIYGDGSSYEGYWSNGKQQGKGLFIDKTGRRFDGSWFNGVMTQQV